MTFEKINQYENILNFNNTITSIIQFPPRFDTKLNVVFEAGKRNRN